MKIAEKSTVIGIDIGGTKIRIGLVSDSGILLQSIHYSTYHGSFFDFYNSLIDNLEHFFLHCTGAKDAIGFGVGMKGFVDYKQQVILHSSILKQEKEPVDICGPLQNRFNLPVVIDNDVHAGALAEIRYGTGRGKDHFIFINIGTGTAIGAVVNGYLVRGNTNRAGEVGLTLLRRPGEFTTYPMENIASGAGIDIETRRLVPDMANSPFAAQILQDKAPVRLQTLLDAANNDDILAKKVLDNLLDSLSITLYNLNLLFDSEVYIFGGGLASNSWLLNALREKLQHLCLLNGLIWQAELTVSTLGSEYIGVVGAASLFWDAVEHNNLEHTKGE